MAETETLTPRQRQALATWTATGNASQAAQAAHVSRKTFYRWLRMPAFVQACTEAQAEAMGRIQADLVRLAECAGAVLQAAMADPAAPHAVKIQAAQTVYANLLKVRELTALESRLADLERALGLTAGR